MGFRLLLLHVLSSPRTPWTIAQRARKRRRAGQGHFRVSGPDRNPCAPRGGGQLLAAGHSWDRNPCLREDDADLRVLMRVHQLYVALGGVQGDIDADRLNTMVSCLGLDTLISSDRVEAAFLCRKLPHSLHRHHVRAHHPDPQCNAKPESAGAEGVGSEPSSPPMPPPAPPLDLEAFIQILLQLGSTAFPEEESTGIRQEPAPLDSLNRLLKHFHDGVVFPAARRAAGKNASRKCAAGTVKGGQTCGQDEVGAGSRGQPPSGEVTRSADAPSGKLQSQQARDAGSAEAVRASKEEEEEEE